MAERLIKSLKRFDVEKSLAKTIFISSKMVMMHANDLLDQSIIENGGFIPFYTDESVNDVILEIVDLVRMTTVRKRNLKIEFLGKPNRTLVKFDKRRFQQVLLNLLSNAVKYTIEGVVAVNFLLEKRG